MLTKEHNHIPMITSARKKMRFSQNTTFFKVEIFFGTPVLLITKFDRLKYGIIGHEFRNEKRDSLHGNPF